MTKSELRKIYLARQKSFSDEERKTQSLAIAERFFENFSLINIRFLHVFLPIEKNREIDTSFVYKRLWKDFPEIVTIVSRVNFQTMTLENLKFDSLTNLVKNKWHILEPTENELFEIERIDAVLVPLLCFDRRGFRVGYGKGFYDKFLSECRTDCLKIGLSYFEPIDELFDAQNFDVRLDCCITPKEIFTAET
ncbi:MAG TPA: 5-formyltetrahydrofolate cyclo-ligase [Pyrinomonadaceae bacterium]|nr:5-formyltetrahydrofolate cyclo-ligase [Pyrinomonadaceae bacterium]